MKTALANQSYAGAPLNYPRKLRFVQSDAEEKFRAKVEEIMRAEGADEDFILRTLTESAVKEAIINHFTPESVAWALLQ